MKDYCKYCSATFQVGDNGITLSRAYFLKQNTDTVLFLTNTNLSPLVKAVREIQLSSTLR